jgi:hypothetical protein
MNGSRYYGVRVEGAKFGVGFGSAASGPAEATVEAISASSRSAEAGLFGMMTRIR